MAFGKKPRKFFEEHKRFRKQSDDRMTELKLKIFYKTSTISPPTPKIENQKAFKGKNNFKTMTKLINNARGPSQISVNPKAPISNSAPAVISELRPWQFVRYNQANPLISKENLHDLEKQNRILSNPEILKKQVINKNVNTFHSSNKINGIPKNLLELKFQEFLKKKNTDSGIIKGMFGTEQSPTISNLGRSMMQMQNRKVMKAVAFHNDNSLSQLNNHQPFNNNNNSKSINNNANIFKKQNDLSANLKFPKKQTQGLRTSEEILKTFVEIKSTTSLSLMHRHKFENFHNEFLPMSNLGKQNKMSTNPIAFNKHAKKSKEHETLISYGTRTSPTAPSNLEYRQKFDSKNRPRTMTAKVSNPKQHEIVRNPKLLQTDTRNKEYLENGSSNIAGSTPNEMAKKDIVESFVRNKISGIKFVTEKLNDFASHGIENITTLRESRRSNTAVKSIEHAPSERKFIFDPHILGKLLGGSFSRKSNGSSNFVITNTITLSDTNSRHSLFPYFCGFLLGLATMLLLICLCFKCCRKKKKSGSAICTPKAKFPESFSGEYSSRYNVSEEEGKDGSTLKHILQSRAISKESISNEYYGNERKNNLRVSVRNSNKWETIPEVLRKEYATYLFEDRNKYVSDWLRKMNGSDAETEKKLYRTTDVIKQNPGKQYRDFRLKNDKADKEENVLAIKAMKKDKMLKKLIDNNSLAHEKPVPKFIQQTFGKGKGSCSVLNSTPLEKGSQRPGNNLRDLFRTTNDNTPAIKQKTSSLSVLVESSYKPILNADKLRQSQSSGTKKFKSNSDRISPEQKRSQAARHQDFHDKELMKYRRHFIR